MGKFVSSISGPIGDRIFQIASVWSQSKVQGVQFGPHVALPESVQKTLSAGLRNLSPFLECTWPLPEDSEAHSGSIDKINIEKKQSRYELNTEQFSVTRHFRRNEKACVGYLGLYQNPKYFSDTKEDILKWFQSTPIYFPTLTEEVLSVLSNCIGIDLYLPNEKADRAQICDLNEHYKSAFQRICLLKKPKTLFIVCEDIQTAKLWVLRELKTTEPIRIIFMCRTFSPLESLWMLSLCDTIIGGNSTFSWWACFKRNKWNQVYLPSKETWGGATSDLFPEGCNVHTKDF